MPRLIIAGGGLAGCLSALALAARRPEVDLIVVEQGASFGGNHTWSFFDTDLMPENRWVLDGISASHWDRHELRFPKRERTIAIGYNSIRSEALDARMRQLFRPEQYRLGRSIVDITPTSLILEGGERLEGDAVIDARGATTMPGLTLAWQKFVGITYRFEAPHGVSLPVIMDATVEQIDGYRFIYQLPLSETELLIEDTYYSHAPQLDDEALRKRIASVAKAIGARSTVIAEERGVLPVVLDGDASSLWSGPPIPRIGVRGGFFHPTTSYSLPDAVANAALLSGESELAAPALYSTLRAQAERLWRDRSFFRLLNRLLFRAAAPHEEYRVLEHFYRLPPDIVARFYAARLTAIDKVRVLSGRPPVPLGRALGVLWSTAA